MEWKHLFEFFFFHPSPVLTQCNARMVIDERGKNSVILYFILCFIFWGTIRRKGKGKGRQNKRGQIDREIQ
jgi:hypothetical protein